MNKEIPLMPLRDAGVKLIDCVHKTPAAAGQGFPYIAIPQLTEGRIDIDSARRISEQDMLMWNVKCNPQEDDVILSRRCNPGVTAVVPKHFRGSLSQNLVLLRATDPNLMAPKYLRWATRGREWWNEVGRFINVGAVFESLRCVDIPYFAIPVPPVAEQKAIAHILGTLDDKIELNRKTNETLEAMAKALFKSWFVDFDPVRAKAEGRPTGLPAEISDLFPDSFEDSELGDIPREWSIVQLGDLIELAYGKPLKEEQRNGGIYSVFGSNGVVGSHDDYLVEAPGIVIGRKGNPGTVEWSERNFYPIDTTFFVVNKKTGLGMRFLFYSLKNQNLADLSADSAVPGLNRNHAYLNAQMLPPAKVACAFESYSEVIFKRREVLADEIIALSATRDALLPKLISGEIRIPDAEKMLENFLS
jgi:type I restriction enzyme S subunit